LAFRHPVDARPPNVERIGDLPPGARNPRWVAPTARCSIGFSVINQDQPLGIVRLGTNKVLVSLNRQTTTGMIDHFAIGIPQYNKESAARYLQQRGAA
jgi:hypothetical protein